MAKPLILYRSLLRSASAVITDPGTEPDFSIANLKDLKAYTLWKSSGTATPITIEVDLGVADPEAADYLLLVNHNLHTLSATIKVRCGNSYPPSTTRLTASIPDEDTASYFALTADATLYRYWSFALDTGSPPFAAKPYIAELFCGLKTELPHFLTPDFDPFFRQVAVRGGTRSQGGHALGVTLQGQTHRGTISFGDAGAARAEFTDSLNAFIDGHALLRRPFGFVLDADDADFSAARYLKVPDDARVDRLAVGGTWQNLTFHLPVEEAFVEPA